MVTNKSNKKKDLTTLLVGVLIVFVTNYIGSFAFERFDLTSEKRYTLSENSKKLTQDLKDIIYVKVYLEGEFPAGFKRLRDETKEMLDEFRAYSNGNIEYEFINPSESSDEKIKEDIYRQLFKEGLRPTDLNVKEDNGMSNKIIWPGAIFTYRGKNIPVQLLKSQMGVSGDIMLNSSIEALEYEVANAIRNLVVTNVPKVALIEGHGELNKVETASLATMLSEYYIVDRISLNEELHSLTERVMVDSLKAYKVYPKYNTIIIAKPTQHFSEKDKFVIDQYVMYGGKVVWLVDPVFATMDSLQNSDVTMAVAQDLNLDDMLFTYGVRLNSNLIMDMQSAPIPVVTGRIGNQPKTQLFPWYFFPLLTQANSHPIVNNLNAVRAEFVSTIDTISKPEIQKTGLLKSSIYTKVSNTPTRVSLGLLRLEPDQSQFNSGIQVAAVLLEGKFESVFKNRVPLEIQNSNEISFKEKSDFNQMVVIADGDIAKNYVNTKTDQYYQLGYDRFTNQQFGNDDFLLNVVNYLCDDTGLMGVRSKKLTIRLMDKNILKNEKTKWQAINTVLPIGLILLFGIFHFVYRKRKYSNE
ncbi:MAG: gliding motility-associated ABC transporter substrate-binding protein GldG [Flavobacteriales bacterium]|nr:gliding motility-associated ABC transporter substrate-binding protein GldG [Flavobacteriales bacterium]